MYLFSISKSGDRFTRGALVTDFSFLKDLRRRIALGGNGPRAVVATGSTAYVAEYFSDTVSVVDLESGSPRKEEEGGFDTPTLVECWRTAPYWHDGSAANMKELLTTKNRGDKHGRMVNRGARPPLYFISPITHFKRP